MKIKSIIIFLFLLFWSVTAQAQTLGELLSIAKQNNLELKVLEKEYFAALENAPQVNQMPDPEVGVGGYPFPVETRLGAQAIRFSGTQMIPWPGVLERKKELELAKAKPLFERIAVRELELNHEVKLGYYRLYEIQQSQAIIRHNITILKSLEQLALSKVESGKSSAADVLSVQLKIEELSQELKILETAKVSPTATINQLLNRNLNTPISITDSLSYAVLPFDKNALLSEISATHPILRMFELQQEASQQAISMNELNGKPSFGVGLDYIMVNKRIDAEPANNGRDILQLRASMKIPLFREQYAAKEREEQLKIEALEDRKEDAFTRFSAAIERAYAEHETASLKVELYHKQMEITEAAISILETDYSTRGNRFDELLRLEKELVDYDLKMLRAIVQSHIAKSGIERFIIQ